MKRCTDCGRLKKLADFYKHPSGKDGRMTSCKACKKEYSRQYYAQHRERILYQGKLREARLPRAT